MILALPVIPDFFGGTHLDEDLITAGACAAAAVSLWRYIVRPLKKQYKETRMRLRAAATIIARELTHNGGDSVKDAVLTMRDQMLSMHEDMNALRAAGERRDRELAMQSTLIGLLTGHITGINLNTLQEVLNDSTSSAGTGSPSRTVIQMAKAGTEDPQGTPDL